MTIQSDFYPIDQLYEAHVEGQECWCYPTMENGAFYHRQQYEIDEAGGLLTGYVYIDTPQRFRAAQEAMAERQRRLSQLRLRQQEVRPDIDNGERLP